MARCPLCGTEYDHPGLALDRAFAESIGAEVGETCDNCSLVLISGSPAEIDALLGRVPCEYCGAYDSLLAWSGTRLQNLRAPPNPRGAGRLMAGVRSVTEIVSSLIGRGDSTGDPMRTCVEGRMSTMPEPMRIAKRVALSG
jgi:hypothetical protein